MARRPTPHDDDEALLREQEAFLRKNKPSAKVVRMSKESPKAPASDHGKIEIDEVQQVLFEIQEKMSIVESEKPAGHPDGFPKVFSLGNTTQIGGKKKGKSLFKQKMEERKKKQGGTSENRPPPRLIPVRSLVEDEKIGHENAERLAKLSMDEIEEERKQLLAKLDPSMLEFIRKRRYQGSSSEKEGSKVKLLENSSFKTEHGADVKIPLEKVDDKWLNFAHVEPEKLEWMQDIEIKEIKGDVKVRVDFNGDVVNPISEISWREGLHHHGDEEQVPGYSMQELLGLSNSRLLQQRQIAYKALEGVVRNARLQQGDRTLFVAPKLLLQAGLIVVVRRELDSESLQSQEMALRLLHALVGPLDKTVDYVNIKSSFGEFKAFDETDHDSLGDGLIEHSSKDLISALLSMHILARFRFLLQNPASSDEIKRLVSQILLVFAGHSLTTANRIFEENFLVEALLPDIGLMGDDSSAKRLRVFLLMIKHGKTLALKLVDNEHFMGIVYAALFGPKEVRNVGLEIARCLLQFRINNNVFEKMVQDFVKAPEKYAGILVESFLCAERNIQLYERFRSIVCSTQTTSKTYIPFVTTLLKLFREGKESHKYSSIPSDLCEITFESDVGESLWEQLDKLRAPSSNVSPLPAVPLGGNIPLMEDCTKIADYLAYLSALIDIDRIKAIELIKKSSILDLLIGIIDVLKLTYETELLIVSIVRLGCQLKTLLIDKDLECFVARWHGLSFRASLLLPVVYSELQLQFYSNFFDGSLFSCKADSNITEDHLSTIHKILPEISSIRGQFLATVRQFLPPTSWERSRRLLSKSEKCDTLIIGGPGLTPSLPSDIVFMKVIELATILGAGDNAAVEDNANSEAMKALLLAHFCTIYRKNSIPGVQGSSLFVRLALVFLCPPQISMSSTILDLIKPLLKLSVQKSSLVHNSVIPIADCPSFTDFYIKLLDAFEGHGYSHSLFGSVLLIPLIYSTELKLILWGDKQPMLQTITNDFTNFILPFEEFIRVPETSTRLVQLYLAAVASKTVTVHRNVVLYCFAVYQINQYLMNLQIDRNPRESILRLVLSAEKEVQKDILFFSKATTDFPHIEHKKCLEEGPKNWIILTIKKYRLESALF